MWLVLFLPLSVERDKFGPLKKAVYDQRTTENESTDPNNGNLADCKRYTAKGYGTYAPQNSQPWLERFDGEGFATLRTIFY
jgi:hypothetical protein